MSASQLFSGFALIFAMSCGAAAHSPKPKSATPPSSAQGQPEKHQHAHEASAHEHGKHVHGEGRMDVAFEDLKGEVEFTVSADVILGTENAPKSAQEKETEKKKIDSLISNFRSSVNFSAGNCRWTSVKAEVDRHQEGRVEHAEVDLDAEVVCEKTVKGARLNVGLGQHYPALKKIELQVVAPDLQKGAVITPQTQYIDLK